MGQLSDLCWMMALSSGAFFLYMFSDLSSPHIYPPGPLRWSECQVLVDVGRELANMICFAYKFHISENSLRMALKPSRTNGKTPSNLLSLCGCVIARLVICRCIMPNNIASVGHLSTYHILYVRHQYW
jgi:hypothetical protein